MLLKCLKCGGKKKKLGGKPKMQEAGFVDPIDPKLTMGLHNYMQRRKAGLPTNPFKSTGNEGTASNPMTPWEWNHTAPPPRQSANVDPYFLMQGATNGLAWLSGMVERNRQNQYYYNQMASFGQINPMPATDYQPNPYQLYAQMGGKINSKNINSMRKSLMYKPKKQAGGQVGYFDERKVINRMDNSTGILNLPSNNDAHYLGPSTFAYKRGGKISRKTHQMMAKQMKTSRPAPKATGTLNGATMGTPMSSPMGTQPPSPKGGWQQSSWKKGGTVRGKLLAGKLSPKVKSSQTDVDNDGDNFKKGGKWIQGAIKHPGRCTPISRPGCTGHARALALLFKRKHGFHKGK